MLRHLLGASARTRTLARYDPACLDSIHALAEASGIAYSWVHRTVEDLQEAGLVSVPGGIEIIDPLALYRWWAARCKPLTGYGFHVEDPVAVLRQLDEAKVPLHYYEGEHLVPLYPMATTYYAENTYTKHLWPRRMDVYYAGDLTLQAASQVEDGGFVWRTRRLVVDAGGQMGGSNFRLLKGPYRLVRDERERRRFQDTTIPVAPLPQVIVDLLREGGSAAEAAQMMVEKEYA